MRENLFCYCFSGIRYQRVNAAEGRVKQRGGKVEDTDRGITDGYVCLISHLS